MGIYEYCFECYCFIPEETGVDTHFYSILATLAVDNTVSDDNIASFEENDDDDLKPPAKRIKLDEGNISKRITNRTKLKQTCSRVVWRQYK